MSELATRNHSPTPSRLGPVAWLVGVQIALSACAVLMSIWAKISWPGTIGLALLGLTAVAAELMPQAAPGWLWWSSVAISWGCTLFVPASLWLTSDSQFSFERYLDQYYAVLAWLIAAAVLPATHAALEPGFRKHWKLPVMVWACFGAVLWLGTAYQHNLPGAFYIGVLISIALVILWKLWFRLPWWAVQIANTLLLLLIVIPVADRLFHPAYRMQKQPGLRERLYSYQAGHQNPVAYASWWDGYLKEVDSLESKILMPDPEHYLPYRLRPGSQGLLFQSRISINNEGFRGREIPAEKGDTYRIVALGESTTFGITLNAEDRPWPELLEELIRERLKTTRPVEVINAGVPGYTLDDNLFRFAKDILPLHPDLVLSYHGINGFPMLNAAIPSNLGPAPPRYQERPVRFLADCEYRWKLLRYRQRQTAALKPSTKALSDPLRSTYADEYRKLIGLARTNHFRLAVGNFSMAVNAGSDSKIIRFYQVSYPRTPLLIQANAAHSRLLQELAAPNPDICFIDTHPDLDGQCEHFLDLVHFAPSGDRQLAENFFKGIETILQTDLCSPSALAGHAAHP